MMINKYFLTPRMRAACSWFYFLIWGYKILFFLSHRLLLLSDVHLSLSGVTTSYSNIVTDQKTAPLELMAQTWWMNEWRKYNFLFKCNVALASHSGFVWINSKLKTQLFSEWSVVMVLVLFTWLIKFFLEKKNEISRWEFNGPVGLRPADLEQLLYIKITKIWVPILLLC